MSARAHVIRDGARRGLEQRADGGRVEGVGRGRRRFGDDDRDVGLAVGTTPDDAVVVGATREERERERGQ